MKKILSLALSSALLLAPALPVFAADAPTAEATKVETKQDASAAPELPASKDADAPVGDTPEAVTPTGAVELPKDNVVAPGKAKVEAPESPFKLKNFVLGFLGGALVGGATGVLFLSKNDAGTFDQDKARTVAPIAAGVLGLGVGLAAYLLGATTPEEAKPPKVESMAPAAPAVAGVNVAYAWQF